MFNNIFTNPSPKPNIQKLFSHYACMYVCMFSRGHVYLRHFSLRNLASRHTVCTYICTSWFSASTMFLGTFCPHNMAKTLPTHTQHIHKTEISAKIQMLGVTKTRLWQTKMLVCVCERAHLDRRCAISHSKTTLTHTNTKQLHGVTDWPSLTVINGVSGKQLTKRKQGTERERQGGCPLHLTSSVIHSLLSSSPNHHKFLLVKPAVS